MSILGVNIVTQSVRFQSFNDIFNVLVVAMIAFVITAIIWKIMTSGSTADDTIKKIKFSITFLVIIGAIYGFGSQLGLQGDFYKYTAGMSNALINDIDPEYAHKWGKYYGTSDEFGVNGVRTSDGWFDGFDTSLAPQK